MLERVSLPPAVAAAIARSRARLKLCRRRSAVPPLAACRGPRPLTAPPPYISCMSWTTCSHPCRSASSAATNVTDAALLCTANAVVDSTERVLS